MEKNLAAVSKYRDKYRHISTPSVYIHWRNILINHEFINVDTFWIEDCVGKWIGYHGSFEAQALSCLLSWKRLFEKISRNFFKWQGHDALYGWGSKWEWNILKMVNWKMSQENGKGPQQLSLCWIVYLKHLESIVELQFLGKILAMNRGNVFLFTRVQTNSLLIQSDYRDL